jgi:hypothetical protein
VQTKLSHHCKHRGVATIKATEKCDILYSTHPVYYLGLVMAEPAPRKSQGLVMAEPAPRKSQGLVMAEPAPRKSQGLVMAEPAPRKSQEADAAFRNYVHGTIDCSYDLATYVLSKVQEHVSPICLSRQKNPSQGPVNTHEII